MSSFGWLLDLLPAATPASKGVAPGVAKEVDANGRAAPSTDEVPHLPHLPHPKTGEVVNDAERLADLAEHLTERAAILQFEAGLDRADADVAAVRIVQCSTCTHWTPDPVGDGGGIGTCATGADWRSWSAFDFRPLSAWPDARRYCAEWGAATHG